MVTGAGAVATVFGGEPVHLLPERAAWLPRQCLLLVADAHIGKAQAYRRLGQPVPEGTTQATLDRLDRAIARCGASHVVFLGDLLHAAAGRSPAVMSAVATWRQRNPELQLTLVVGNHDRHAGAPPADWRVAVVEGPWQPDPQSPLALDHEPQVAEGRFVLAGHVHPAAVLGGRAHQRLRLPCFHLGPQVGVLPAFGEFTGMHVMPRGPSDRVFVIADNSVHELPRC
ncbi:MAG: ligase-associated DNA damage response endonuclease PdeM [Rubrivivax sp.]|jgi:DNA ligase-associated metallophosphoesterase|nr:ligase-associated DNA damage response endonuclease PdeM [Rubrivivax sp.]